MKKLKVIMGFLAAYATFVMLVSLFPKFTNQESVGALRMTGFIVYATTFLLFSFLLIRSRIKNNNLKFIAALLGYLSSFILIVLGLREINFEAGSSLLKITPYIFIGTLGACGIFFYRFRKSIDEAAS